MVMLDGETKEPSFVRTISLRASTSAIDAIISVDKQRGCVIQSGVRETVFEQKDQHCHELINPMSLDLDEALL